MTALRVSGSDVRDMAWVDNGPGWVGVDLGDAERVLDVVPDIAAFADLKVTVLSRWGWGSGSSAPERSHGRGPPRIVVTGPG